MLLFLDFNFSNKLTCFTFSSFKKTFSEKLLSSIISLFQLSWMLSWNIWRNSKAFDICSFYFLISLIFNIVQDWLFLPNFLSSYHFFYHYWDRKRSYFVLISAFNFEGLFQTTFNNYWVKQNEIQDECIVLGFILLNI